MAEMAGYGYGMGFPMGYQQQYTPGYQTQAPGQQLMTPPTIHAEIIQVSGRDEAENWPVGPGQSQMMMARDDSAIYIKTVYANGQAAFLPYLKEQPKPPAPQPDYVTREELEARLAELMKPKQARKKEVPTDGADV